MKKIFVYSIIASFFLFFGCNPKTAEMTKSTSKVVQVKESFRKKPPLPGPAPLIQLGAYQKFSLDNGLQVIVVSNDKLPKVSFRLFVDVPLFKEGDYAGYAELAGALMGTGTTTRKKADIDEAVDFIGAEFNTSSQGIFASGLKKHQEKLLDIMSDVLLHPDFPTNEFDKIKKQKLSGLAADKDDANAIAARVRRVLDYGRNHPYGEIETEATIKNVTVDMCKNYYDEYFKPNISYLIVVGDITTGEMIPLAKKYFGSWKKGTVKTQKFPMPKPPATTQVDFVDKAGAVQSVINITYPVDLKKGSPDAIPASVMNTMLGGFFRSRLNNNLREDKAYTYGVRSALRADKEVGYFNAGGSVRNEVTDSALVQFFHEFDRLRTQMISDDELKLVKSVMAGQFGRSLENPQTVARFALNIARYNLPEDYYARYLEKLSRVSKGDVLRMAQKYIKPKNAHVLVVGNKDDVAEKLKRFAASGKINYFDTEGKPLTNTATIKSDLTGEQIIANYLKAIGGKDKLKSVKTLITAYKAEVQGMSMENTEYRTADGKYATTFSMNGNIAQKMVFDGEKGTQSAMGQSKPLEGEELKKIELKAKPFPELYFGENNYKLIYKGTETINGTEAHKVLVLAPGGVSKKTVYFDAATGLKIRTVQTEQEQGKTMVISYDFGDYREKDGIKYPFSMSISGVMPMPLKMENSKFEINKPIDGAVFK